MAGNPAKTAAALIAARDQIRVVGALLIGALPLIGVLFFGWKVFYVLAVFWLENVAIGVAQAARLVLAGIRNRSLDTVFVLPFFCVHYGMFTAVHGGFVLALFGSGSFTEPAADPVLAAAHIPTLLAPLLWSAAVIAIWQAALLVIDARRTDFFHGRAAQQIMFEPYGRVMILHVTILAGGFAVAALGSPVWAVVVLVALKIAIDVGVLAVTPKSAQPQT